MPIKKDLMSIKNAFDPIKAKEIICALFDESYKKELYRDIYFEIEYPEETDKEGEKSRKNGNPLDDDVYIVNYEGLNELNDLHYEFISLFEAALIIGYRIDSLIPYCLLTQSVELFIEAIFNREIDPRDPINNIPYSKSPYTDILLNDELIKKKPAPDLSWTLTLKEVAEFAILKGYPEELFSDLLTCSESKENDSVSSKNKYAKVTPIPKESEKQKQPENKDENFKIKSKTHAKFLVSVEGFNYRLEEIRKTNPNKRITIVNDIAPWIKNKGFKGRLGYVLARFIVEHYDL